MEKVENRRMDWGKHKEAKLVHEVKKEVYSRDKARHTEKNDLWYSDKEGKERRSICIALF